MEYEKGKSPFIKNIIPGLPERGKIKIGIKGSVRTSAKGNEFQPPQKLNHFIVTGLQRDDTGNFIKDKSIHEKIGDKPTRIPVLLMYNDPFLNFQSRYACFTGRTPICTGDGEYANRIENDKINLIKCPCERIAPDYKGKEKCKPNGILSVVIRDVGVIGGIWKFRTTSFNTIKSIHSSMLLLSKLSEGIIAGIPLDMVLYPKEAQAPGTNNFQTIYIVTLEYVGDVKQLRADTIQKLIADKSYSARIENLEKQAKEAFSVEEIIGDVDDTVEEFYPDQAMVKEPKSKRTRAKKAEPEPVIESDETVETEEPESKEEEEEEEVAEETDNLDIF